jgi:GGDEF domain-containing protein
MVSLKRYLSGNDTELKLRQTLSDLVGKIGSSAVEVNPLELHTFRDDISRFHEAVSCDLPTENIATLVESATAALEVYNRRISKTIARQSGEFQAIIKMLQNSLVNIAGEHTEAVRGLTRLSDDLGRSSGFRDLEPLKVHLAKCLSGLRDEIEREKTASKGLIERLRIEIENARAANPLDLSRNFERAPLVGDQQACIAALEKAFMKGTRHYALVMVVNRVQPVTARFGKDAVNRMVLRFREFVRTQLDPSDGLFRWNGATVVAVLERQHSFDQVRLIVKRMLASSIEETYEFAGRSVLLPISAAWSVVTLTSEPTAAVKQIERFIAGQGCRDFA